MGAFDYFIGVYREYFNFDGRARRSEYWFFLLFYNIFSILLTVVDYMIFKMEALSLILALVSIIPSLAVGARRLHDIDKSGWWQLLYLIPIIGWIVMLVFNVTKGTEGANRFGEDPIVD